MENQPIKNYDEALKPLRKKIDDIDEEIISLLAQRMEVIFQVGELKKNHQEKFFIRSNREADMIKNLVKKSSPHFSKSTIVNIWRKIVSTANIQEQNLCIAIHNPKNNQNYFHLVREYYCDEIPILTFDSATNTIAELEKNSAQIGIFALPQNSYDENEKKEDSKENWWINLANNRIDLRVFAKIPLVEFKSEENKYNQDQLVAVAIKEPEKSSSDKSLLYIEASKEINKTQILSALKEQNLNAKILKLATINQVEGIIFYLIELDGFYLETSEEIKNLSKNKIKVFTKILGHYPTSI